jgi:glycosyltransferase involved in cell wall biosynthesis
MVRADAIVLPSYREGTPRTLLEGGALAKPLITTDVPGCRHVVNDGVNGFLAEVRNPRSLADKMLLFLSLSPDERKQLGQNARKWIEEHYDEQRVIDLYTAKIQQLVEKMD